MQSHSAMSMRSGERAALSVSKTPVITFLEKYSLALCLLLVTIACARIISTYNALSLTADEPFHLACAIEYLSNHSITLDVENPPIAQAIEGLGPYLAGVRLSGRVDPWLEGADILARSGSVGGMIFRLRLGTLPFFLLACCVVGVWASHFFGKATAVLSVALYTLLPTTPADAGLGTTDMALASTTGAAFLAAILWAEKPDWLRAIVMAFFTALALLSKFSALGYLGFSLGLATLVYLHTSIKDRQDLLLAVRQHYKTFALAVASTLFFIWAAYWLSLGLIPGYTIIVPAPEYFEGMRAVLAHNRGGHHAFLLGHHNPTGWWYYFPVALAFKTPIAFLILTFVGGVVCYRRHAAISYLLPFAFVLGILLPAMMGRIDIGIRHIAPIYLGLSVMAALGLLQLLESHRFRLLSSLAAVALVLWMIVSVAIQHPDYLAYFNGFAGKHPENVLVDSNYDWGQDLKLLSKRLHQLGAHHVSLGSLDGAIRNRYREEWYGLPKIVLLDDITPSPGWTAVSASFDKSYRFLLPWRPHVLSPWYEQVARTRRLGPYILYYVPPAGDSGGQNIARP
jgi:hypothetical protein